MLSNLVYTLPILQAVGARSWPRFWASLSSPHTLGVAAHTLPGSDSKLESTAMLRALGRSVHLAGVKPGRLLQVLRACGHLHRPAHHTSFVLGGIIIYILQWCIARCQRRVAHQYTATMLQAQRQCSRRADFGNGSRPGVPAGGRLVLRAGTRGAHTRAAAVKPMKEVRAATPLAGRC